MAENKKSFWIVVVAILGIVVIELFALYRGIDGKGLAFSLALLSGLGGYRIGLSKDKIKSIIGSLTK